MMRALVLSMILLNAPVISFAQTADLGENEIRVEFPGIKTSVCMQKGMHGWLTRDNPVTRLERVLLARQHGFPWDIDDTTLEETVRAKRYEVLRKELDLPPHTPAEVVDEWLLLEPIKLSERRRLGLSPNASDQEFRAAYRADWDQREEDQREMKREFERTHGVSYTLEAATSVKLGLPLDSTVELLNDIQCQKELKRYATMFGVPDATSWQEIVTAAEQ